MKLATIKQSLFAMLMVALVGCSDGTATQPTQPGAIESVTVVMATTTLHRADVVLASVRVIGRDGQEIVGRAAAFVSSNPAIALIDASGRVRAVSPGAANISATVDGVVGTKTIQVTAEDTELNLSHMNGTHMPVLVATDTLITNGAPDFRETYLESGTLKLSGTTPLRYRIDLVYYEYYVRIIDGRRQLVPFGPQPLYDFGRLTYDAAGDLQMLSEYVSPVAHTASPVSAGMQTRYRIPGDDTILTLLFRREY